MKAQFLVSAGHSGAGKTTVTLGLLRSFQQQGLLVQPFKCGPDYIDPIHHRTAAGRDSINLDGYMMSTGHIRELYAQNSADADVCITEGVMGLFDGSRKSEGSSAALAILLDLPVILVLNARAMAYSAAALLFGLKNFDPRLRIAGVIFNFVDSPHHYRLLQEACTDVGVAALGHLPNSPALRIPSRHLGLDTANANEAIDAAAAHIARHVDLTGLLAATAVNPAAQAPETQIPAPAFNHPQNRPATNRPVGIPTTGRPRNILVARDAAFHFLYPENIKALEQWGHVQYFSPLETTHLPKDVDLLYLPGGYPELYLKELSENLALLQDIREFAGTQSNRPGENGSPSTDLGATRGKILAECGGMMFLGRSITDANGQTWPMVGLLDLATTMAPKKLSLGYRTAEINGYPVKGHEFHYSQYVGPAPVDPIFHEPHLLAGYMHFYWGEDPAGLYSWLGQ